VICNYFLRCKYYKILESKIKEAGAIKFRCNLFTFIDKLINSFIDKKWPVWKADFYPTNQSNLKSFQKALIGWKKPAL